MALSRNGKTFASGSEDGKVRLWVIETGKVVAKGMRHSGVSSLRAEKQLILEIKTWHKFVWTVICSPDNTQITTGRQRRIKNLGYKDGRAALISFAVWHGHLR